MLFTRPGLEQATPEPVARQRAARLLSAVGAGAPVLDLCCGIGGDTLALAGAGAAVVAVDRDPASAWLARFNTGAYDEAARAVVADVTGLRLRSTDVVHVDPARRVQSDGGRRGGYEPDLAWCFGLPARRVVIKAAPGLDHDDIAPAWAAEWVSLDRQLRAAVLWSPDLAGETGDGAGGRRATVIAGTEVTTLLAEPEVPRPPVREPGSWVVDPDPAVTRAGAVADLAAALDGWLIDDRIGFVCTASEVATPLGRMLRVAASLPWSVRAVAAELVRLDAGDLQIRRRGLAGDVTALHRRLQPRNRRGGPRVTLLMTRHRDRPWALLCTDPP